MSTTTTKFNKTFDLFDVDRDDAITFTDLHTAAERVAADLLPAGEPGAADLRHEISYGYTLFWDQLTEAVGAVEADSLSRAQYVAALESGALDTEREYGRSVDTIAEALMAALDADHDGRLTQSEYTAIFTAFGVEAPAAKTAFAGLDRDRDGRLSRDEFRTAVREFFLSRNPETPGSRLPG